MSLYHQISNIVHSDAHPDIERMKAGGEAFVSDVAKELERVNALREKARLKRRRSKALPNLRRLADKWGLSPEGNQPLDMLLGGLILGSVFSGDLVADQVRAAVRSL